MSRNMPARTIRKKDMEERQLAEAKIFKEFYNSSLVGLDRFVSKISVGNAAAFLLQHEELVRRIDASEVDIRGSIKSKMRNDKPEISSHEIFEAQDEIAVRVKQAQKIDYEDDLQELCDHFGIDPEIVSKTLEHLSEMNFKYLEPVEPLVPLRP